MFRARSVIAPLLHLSMHILHRTTERAVAKIYVWVFFNNLHICYGFVFGHRFILNKYG